MAGHMQARGQCSSRRHSQPQPQPSQSSQIRKRPDSKRLTQGAASTHTHHKSDDHSGPSKPKLRTSCDGCQEAKLGCSQEKPTCRRCLRHGIPCVYSPFRRIGRPRKSTNPRCTNRASSGKCRGKKEDADEMVDVSPVEGLPELENDSHFGSMFFDPVPAPPSSPASPESGNGGSWYPWTADGNCFCNGLPMSLDHSNNLIDGVDHLSNTVEYVDLDMSLDNHHDMFMDCTLPRGDGAFQGLGQSMQPTPPSSTTAELMTFEEAMPEDLDTHHMSTWPSEHAQLDQSRTYNSSTSTSADGASGLKSESSYPDFDSLKALRSHGLDIPFQSQISKPSISQAFVPSPELTPPPSAKTLSANMLPMQTPCNKNCSSALIKQSACLNQHLSDNATSSLDTVLQVEKDTHSLCQKIITCTPCIINESSYLLFTMVLEQIIHLLEANISQKTPALDSCTICIGAFELDKDTKVGFLKRYLFSRLGGFADLLSEFTQVIRNADVHADVKTENEDDIGEDDGDGPPDYNLKVAKGILKDVYRRLDLLKRSIESWR